MIFRQAHLHVEQHGMTLIEVLVALVVVGVALAAVITSVNTGIANVAYMKERSFAHWVAVNQETNLQLTENVVGTKWTEETMAEREWQVRTRLITTNDPAILRAYIDVFNSRDDEEPVAQLISYIGKPT